MHSRRYQWSDLWKFLPKWLAPMIVRVWKIYSTERERERERETEIVCLLGMTVMFPPFIYSLLSMQCASSIINPTRFLWYTGVRNISLHLQQPISDSGLIKINDAPLSCKCFQGDAHRLDSGVESVYVTEKKNVLGPSTGCSPLL